VQARCLAVGAEAFTSLCRAGRACCSCGGQFIRFALVGVDCNAVGPWTPSFSGGMFFSALVFRVACLCCMRFWTDGPGCTWS